MPEIDQAAIIIEENENNCTFQLINGEFCGNACIPVCKYMCEKYGIIDALHYQKEKIEKILYNGGDYVVQLKANQGNFYQDVIAMFEDKFMDINNKENNYEIYTTIEKNHGRI